MAVNKVEYFGETLIDLTEDTVTEDTLADGVTAHAANGDIITGRMTASGGSPVQVYEDEDGNIVVSGTGGSGDLGDISDRVDALENALSGVEQLTLSMANLARETRNLVG